MLSKGQKSFSIHLTISIVYNIYTQVKLLMMTVGYEGPASSLVPTYSKEEPRSVYI